MLNVYCVYIVLLYTEIGKICADCILCSEFINEQCALLWVALTSIRTALHCIVL